MMSDANIQCKFCNKDKQFVYIFNTINIFDGSVRRNTRTALSFFLPMKDIDLT